MIEDGQSFSRLTELPIMVICAPTDDAEGNRRVNWVLFKWVISNGIKGKSECVAVGVFV